MSNFTMMRASEQDVFTVDYAPLLGPDETIEQATWSSTAVDGTDANAAATIIGVATIDGSLVSQMIGNCKAGVTYAPTCTALTSTGRKLVLPDPNSGLLYVSL